MTHEAQVVREWVFRAPEFTQSGCDLWLRVVQREGGQSLVVLKGRQGGQSLVVLKREGRRQGQSLVVLKGM